MISYIYYTFFVRKKNSILWHVLHIVVAYILRYKTLNIGTQHICYVLHDLRVLQKMAQICPVNNFYAILAMEVKVGMPKEAHQNV